MYITKKQKQKKLCNLFCSQLGFSHKFVGVLNALSPVLQPFPILPAYAQCFYFPILLKILPADDLPDKRARAPIPHQRSYHNWNTELRNTLPKLKPIAYLYCFLELNFSYIKRYSKIYLEIITKQFNRIDMCKC